MQATPEGDLSMVNDGWQVRRLGDVFEPWVPRGERGLTQPLLRRATDDGGGMSRLLGLGLEGRARDLSSPGAEPRRKSGLVMAGLTTAAVLSVLHELKARPHSGTGGPWASLAAATGALLIEHLAREVDPQAEAGVSWALAEPALLHSRFMLRFGLSPHEAWLSFVRFIGHTEGRPRLRLEGTVYGW